MALDYLRHIVDTGPAKFEWPLPMNSRVLLDGPKMTDTVMDHERFGRPLPYGVPETTEQALEVRRDPTLLTKGLGRHAAPDRTTTTRQRDAAGSPP